MRAKRYFYFFYYIIFYNRYSFASASPLIGNDVRNANDNEFPFVVSFIRIHRHSSRVHPKNHVCTGTLISRHDIVTAEHCVIFEDVDRVEIATGCNNLRRCLKYGIIWWITFDQWCNMNGKHNVLTVNDIACIRIVKEVSNSINPVQLPSAYESVTRFYGSEATAVGWGRLNNTKSNSKLKAVNLRILTNDECMQRFIRFGDTGNDIRQGNVLCSIRHPYALLNDGDSGGPLLHGNVLIGVNKGTGPTSLPDRDPNLVNLHMAVSFYIEFLNNIMSDVN